MSLVATDLTTRTAISEVPREEFANYPPRSTYDIFRLAAERNPGGAALTFLKGATPKSTKRTHTCKDLFESITQAANLFHRLGVGEKDVVAVMLPILPEASFALWGAQAAGISLPVNYLLGVEQITHMLNAAKAKVLVALGPDPDFDIWEKACDLQKLVPTLTGVLQVNLDGENKCETDSFLEALAGEPSDKLSSGRKISREQTAAYFHTGGTTGAPKLAALSHGNQVFTAWGCRWMFDYCEGDKILNGFPIFHVAGPLDFILSPISAGMEVVLPTHLGMRNPEVVKNHWKLVEEHRIAFLAGVPTSLSAISSVPVEGADISCAKCWITGGSPLPVELAANFEERFKIPIREIYGMTETSGIAVITPRYGRRKPGASGMAAPLTEIKVTSGVVLMRGPHIFQGYTERAFNDEIFVEPGWLNTGDLGHLDDEGYLFLTGRSKDVIIRGGHNIDPSVIEAAAMEHPDISFSAAVGQPDAYAGEIPVLFVSPKPGRTMESAEVKEFVCQRIVEPQARPKRVLIIDPMPVTAVGKVFKPKLRLIAAQTLYKDLLKEFEDLEIETDTDPKKGMVLRISGITAEEMDSIKDLLAPFNVCCEFVS